MKKREIAHRLNEVRWMYGLSQKADSPAIRNAYSRFAWSRMLTLPRRFRTISSIDRYILDPAKREVERSRLT